MVVAIAITLLGAGCSGDADRGEAELQLVVDGLTGDVFIGTGITGQKQLYSVPGSELTVDSPGEGVRTVTGGVSTLGGDGIERDQVQPIGSNTKVVTAVLVMRLVEAGKLEVEQTLPAVAAANREDGGRLAALVRTYRDKLRRVRLRNLLNHTSGLVDCLDTKAFFRAFERDPLAARTLSELARFGLTQKPLFQPGAPGKWYYSNTDYMLLGMVLEAVTGEPVARQMEALFAEAGMDRTHYAPSPEELGRPPLSSELISGYYPQPAPGAKLPSVFQAFDATPAVERDVPRPEAVQVISSNSSESGPTVGVSPATPEQARRAEEHTRFSYRDLTNSFSLSIAQSAGGIVTDSRDLASFWRKLFDGELVSRETLRRMERTVPTGENSKGVTVTWGFGFGHQQIAPGVLWKRSPELSVWYHLGDIFGYESAGYYVEQGNLVVANTVNAFPLPVGDLGMLRDVLRAEMRPR